MFTAVITTAAMAALIFVLGFLVSIRRTQTDIITGLENDPTSKLNKAVRAHGNAAEYVPVLAVLTIYLGLQGPVMWAEWAMIVAAVSRYLVAIGFLVCTTLARPHPLKAIGAIGTYLSGLALCVGAVLTVV